MDKFNPGTRVRLIRSVNSTWNELLIGQRGTVVNNNEAPKTWARQRESTYTVIRLDEFVPCLDPDINVQQDEDGVKGWRYVACENAASKLEILPWGICGNCDGRIRTDSDYLCESCRNLTDHL